MSEAAKRTIRHELTERQPRDLDRLARTVMSEHEVKETTARDYIRRYSITCRKPNGDMVAILPDVADGDLTDTFQNTNVDGGDTHADDKLNAATIEQEVEKPTQETFSEMRVYEDNGHPLIPRENKDGYFRRRLVGKKTDIQVMTRAFKQGHNLLLKGHAGTGKTGAAKHIAANINQPLYQVNFGRDVRYEDLVGHYVPDGDGDFKWQDGILTAAVRNGGMFLADEINAADGSVTMPLHEVTQKKGDRSLTIRQTGEVIEPHPEFRVVGTLNPNYAGTNHMNRAFQDRFVTLEFDYLSEGSEKGVVMNETNLSEEREDDVERLVDMANDLRESLKNGDIETVVTPRTLIQIASYMEDDFMDIKEATRMVIGGKAGEYDKDAIDKTLDLSL